MTFCVNGAKFDSEQYYRDDDQARGILWKCRTNPVLVTGLRRIGKSWFLRRFEQILQCGATRHFDEGGSPSHRPLEPGVPTAVAMLDAGLDDFERELKEIIARKDPNRVLVIDELEKLAADPARVALLEFILSYRPLILSAAPVIHELAHHRVPSLVKFFEGCEPVILGRLSTPERRALMFQTCDPGTGVAVGCEELALSEEWGGHPLVLQQVGELIRKNPKINRSSLVNAVDAALNGAPRYSYSLYETGLTSRQREALLNIAVERHSASDDPAAAQLETYGAIVSQGGRRSWAVENIILKRYFKELVPPKRAQVRERREPRSTHQPSDRAFTWIHLSDLHFGAGNRERHYDRRKVTSAIARDIRDLQARARRPVDRVFVTGDIAFSAQPEEYDEAKDWFAEVSKAAGVSFDHFRLVPGNHDVDRRLANKPLVRCAHHAVRKKLVELDDLLADADSRATLATKLGTYRSFVEKNFSRHPPPLDGGVDWMEAIVEISGARGPLRVAGLSTVWISDEHDGNREDPFVPNMGLACGPIERAIRTADTGEVVLVLTHHPPHWLDNASSGALESALARFSHVHLCGHVHAAAASAQERVGRPGRAARWVAGAAHGEKGEECSYAWGALRYDPEEARWKAGWAPRLYVSGHDEMRADKTRYNLDDAGFEWTDIKCRWSAPKK